MHTVIFALRFARLNAGNSKEARIEMMTITTKSSISVNLRLRVNCCSRLGVS